MNVGHLPFWPAAAAAAAAEDPDGPLAARRGSSLMSLMSPFPSSDGVVIMREGDGMAGSGDGMAGSGEGVSRRDDGVTRRGAGSLDIPPEDEMVVIKAIKCFD